MSRDEWLTGLKAGDEVCIVRSGFGSRQSYERGVVEGVTQTGRVNVRWSSRKLIFKRDGWLMGGGQWRIEPLDDRARALLERGELLAEVSAFKEWKGLTTEQLRAVAEIIQQEKS